LLISVNPRYLKNHPTVKLLNYLTIELTNQ
jgi:hypothetical protein